MNQNNTQIDPMTRLPVDQNGNLDFLSANVPNTQFGNMNNLNSGFDIWNNGNQGIGTLSNKTPDDFWRSPDTWNNISKGVGTVGALADTYLGFQQLGQAEDQLDFQKEAFWTNYDQQVADRTEATRRRNIAAGNA